MKNDKTDILYGQDYFYEELLGLKFRISPFSFFQTNSLGAEVLYEKARSYVGDTKDMVVFDLYSGTGTIAQMIAPEGCAWVTVMGNMNTLAVASLADAACVIMAEGAALDEAARKKAADREITVLETEEPIFEAALAVWKKLQAGTHEEP